MAEQELLQGRPKAALARLEPLVEESDPEELGKVRLLPYQAWAYLKLGDDERATEVVSKGVERARARGHRLALVELLRVRGMMLSRQHRWDEAEDAFEEAASVARPVRYPYAEARALYEWSSMNIARSDTKQGRDLLAAAEEIFRRLGAQPYTKLTERGRAALS